MIEHVTSDSQYAMPKVTRVEIIDQQGRAFTGYYRPGATVDVQDDGRTIKIFVTEPTSPGAHTVKGEFPR